MDQIQAAAQLIFEARKSRTTIPRLPEALRPATMGAATAIQQAVTKLIQKPVLAWKCAIPKGDRIPCAPIFDVYPQGTVPVVGGGPVKPIEPEIAFVFSKDLPPREAPYSEAEIRSAVGAARLVVEILGSRFSESKVADFYEKAADHIVNESLVLGPEIPLDVAERTREFAFTVASGDETLFTYDGKHPDGAPFGGMVWLVNHLRQQDGLKQGVVITTGSYAGIVEVPFGRATQLTYGSLGVVDLKVVAS